MGYLLAAIVLWGAAISARIDRKTAAKNLAKQREYNQSQYQEVRKLSEVEYLRGASKYDAVNLRCEIMSTLGTAAFAMAIPAINAWFNAQ